MTKEEIKNIFEINSDGIRIVFLVHRSKEGGSNNVQHRHLEKKITTNSEEFFKAVAELKAIKDTDQRPLRIYASLNSRDLNKGIRLFKQRQLDKDYDTKDLQQAFYFNLKNQFISSLMDKSARSQKNFLFDLDEIDERSFLTTKKLIGKRTKIILYYKTKNGYHIITEPFNYYKELSDYPELIKSIHTDSLMLVDY